MLSESGGLFEQRFEGFSGFLYHHEAEYLEDFVLKYD